MLVELHLATFEFDKSDIKVSFLFGYSQSFEAAVKHCYVCYHAKQWEHEKKCNIYH